MGGGDARIRREPFGEAGGQAVERWTLDGGGGLRVAVLSLGAILHAVEVPDRTGRVANVCLGFPDPAGYLLPTSPFFGVIAGRYANRIGHGRFELDGRVVQLAVNDGGHHLHGGHEGFDKRHWQTEDASDGAGPALRLRLHSPDGDQGYPGALQVEVVYALRPGRRLEVSYRATTDAPTIVNLTQHAYWNLAGEGSGDVYGHRLRVNASRYTPVAAGSIPTGELAPVAGTPFDFREPRPIGERIRDNHPQLVLGMGYDHNLVFDRPEPDDGALLPVIRVEEPTTGRTLEIATTEPGVQFYSGNFLDGTTLGSGGGLYRQGDGFCLETQHFPDSPNQPHFPSTVLRPGETYRSQTTFAFGADG
jgi:aldose 1-epimerase